MEARASKGVATDAGSSDAPRKGEKGEGARGKGLWGKGFRLADHLPEDFWGSGETLNLGGSVEEVEPGARELGRESGWQAVGKGKRWGNGGRPTTQVGQERPKREEKGETLGRHIPG